MVASQREPQLVLIDSPEPEIFAVPEGTTYIGRDPSNDIQLRDTSISRIHCYLLREGETVHVFDANSRNRTRVGKRPADGYELRDGEVLRLGRCHLLFRGFGEPAGIAGGRGEAAHATDRKSGLASPPSSGERHQVETSPLFDLQGEGPHWTASGGVVSLPGPEATAELEPPASASRDTSAATRLPFSKRFRTREEAATRRLVLTVALVVLAIAAVGGGLVLGQALVGRGSGFGAWLAGGSNERDSQVLSARLEQIELTLQRQEDNLHALRKLVTASIEKTEQLPEHLQREIEHYRALDENERRSRLDSVQAQLRRLREAVQAGTASSSTRDGRRARTLTLEDLGISGRTSGRDSEGPVEVEDLTPGDADDENRGRTRVVESPEPKKELAAGELRELAERLKEIVGEYADPTMTPGDLEPHLGELSNALGDGAVLALVDVQDYARKLYSALDRNIAHLERQKRALLEKAERETDGEGEEGGYGGGMRGGYGAPNSERHERDQRLLDLSSKKIEILQEHQQRLGRLRDAILQGFAQFDDEAATRAMALRFGSTSDLELRLALLVGLARARATHAVPTLVKELTDRDETLRTAVHQALVAIVGEDLGDKPLPWREWYDSRKIE